MFLILKIITIRNTLENTLNSIVKKEVKKQRRRYLNKNQEFK
jgi:hypothetical protein